MFLLLCIGGSSGWLMKGVFLKAFEGLVQEHQPAAELEEIPEQFLHYLEGSSVVFVIKPRRPKGEKKIAKLFFSGVAFQTICPVIYVQ